MNRERDFLRLLERLVIATEKLAGIEAPKPEPKPESVSGLAHARRETATNDGFSQGGTDPREFFARPDPDAHLVHPHARRDG